MSKDKEIEKAPAQDPRMGEKTPAYLAWLKKNKPEVYAVKFTNWKGK